MPPLAAGCAMKKRTLLKVMLAGAGAVVTGVVGVPSLVAACSPAWKTRRGRNWRAIGPVDRFPAGAMSEAVVRKEYPFWAERLAQETVYIWRASGDEVVVLSRSCTDLGCPLNWDPGSQCFFCPCHGGIFARDGRRMAGPPNRPMHRYASRVRDGMVEIDLNSLPPMV